MKRIFTLLIAILFISSVSFAQQRVADKDGNYENVIRVKITKKAVKQFEAIHQIEANTKNIISSDTRGNVKTSIKSLDSKNTQYSAIEYKRVFRYAGKFEQKHKEFGLDQWYEISFNSKSSVKDLIRAYAEIEEVLHAVPVSEKSLTSIPNETKSLSGAPNDPKFSDQWHYENTGQNGGTPGSDISLLQAWELETGNSNVIVAVEDGGIDVDHPDLVGNMWINTGEIAGNGYDDDNNGYTDDVNGYNFGDGQGTITQDDHGTHVSGTIAAETNNGIGVAGIAGGTGNNDGVRIMSCQVFGSSSQGGFAEAFVYAADMGAHISQNSWGGGGEDQSINDAIDYFIANGGSAGSPMQGGVVIIAAGNSETNTGASIWPAAYPNAIAVAATNCNDARSYYSNYGTWVDISAPGGELISTNDDPTAIHSTYGSGGYGVMQGTSMACPHVSGVAALIVSRFAGSITPSEVRSRLIDNTDNIDAQNSGYLGQMGSGRLNAFASLGGSVVVDTEAPTNPSGLSSSNVTENSVVLNWNAATDNIGVTGYDIYRNGSLLTTVTSTSYTVTGLNSSTTYSFYVKAKDAAGNTSGASNTINVTTDEYVATYCESKGSDFSYEWIAKVQIGTYSNTSNGAAYTDFTSENITLEAGSSVNVALTPGFASSAYNEYWKIWIDYNNDKDFDDANELAYDAGSLSNSSVTGTMNILSTATGTTRMRVSMKYNAAQTACETFSYGEVEDYTVTFGEVIDTEEPTAPTGLSSSSITQTSFTLSWNASSDNVGVTGYDVYQNGSLLGSVTGTSANVTGLTAATTYAMTVKAKDLAGNISATSSSLNVTTDQPDDVEAPTTPTNLAASNVTTNSTNLSWTASTDNVGVTGYDIYRNGSYLANTASTSYSVTSLSSSTTYTFYVKAKDAMGLESNASNTISVTTNDIIAEYCTSKGNNSSYEWISKVVIGSYTNSSGAAGYTDFTSENITLEAGSSVNVALTPGFSGSTYNEYWKIWIDYNNDAVFADSELAFDGGSLSKTTVSGTMNILASANGTTRMRVSMKYNAAPTACETFSYGEVEDYTVTFGDAVLDTEAPSVPTGLSASNVTNSSATISWSASSDNVEVTAYEVYRNGTLIASTPLTSYSASGLNAETTYSFTVKAKDEAGNISATSSALSVTTLTTSTTNLTLTITFDNYPEETSWTLKNNAGSTVASGGTYASQADGSTLVIPINDLADDCYDFTILDAYGDGICCSYGNGSYKLEVTGGSLLASGGSFNSSEVTNFCLPSVSSYALPLNVSDNVSGLSTVKVYPNPASTFINVDVLNGHRVGRINIYNTVGTLVKTLEMNGSEKEIDISELPTGLYIISVEDEKEPLVKQFIKQ